ncbi:MAG: NUMOD4 domain-containing protein [Tateyamaria sp.]|uniref:NUMOD4 domain-containing protein n=1 Tax=Tateyamaria sp. TaxID=1929288 RepID=UPI00329CC35E
MTASRNLKAPPPDTPQERWRDIPGYDRYAVSDLGRVWSKPFGRILKPYPVGGYGHLAVDLTGSRKNNGKRSAVRVNRAVLSAFAGPPPAAMRGEAD